MDTLYWSNLNPEIDRLVTTKQFFNLYLWRMVIKADGARLLTSKQTLEVALAQRKNSALLGYHSIKGSTWAWHSSKHRRSQLDQIDLPLLKSLQQIKLQFGSCIRMRVEEPLMQIYAHDEATLKQIAAVLHDPEFIQSVTGPENHDQEQLLKSGAIIKHTTSKYNYKVVLRDGRYSSQIKQQILNYLDNLGDIVKISRGSRDMLQLSFSNIWGVFFYTNDPNIADFIRLIEPTVVSNIHKLVTTDQ